MEDTWQKRDALLQVEGCAPLRQAADRQAEINFRRLSTRLQLAEDPAYRLPRGCLAKRPARPKLRSFPGTANNLTSQLCPERHKAASTTKSGLLDATPSVALVTRAKASCFALRHLRSRPWSVLELGEGRKQSRSNFNRRLSATNPSHRSQTFLDAEKIAAVRTDHPSCQANPRSVVDRQDLLRPRWHQSAVPSSLEARRAPGLA